MSIKEQKVSGKVLRTVPNVPSKHSAQARRLLAYNDGAVEAEAWNLSVQVRMETGSGSFDVPEDWHISRVYVGNLWTNIVLEPDVMPWE